MTSIEAHSLKQELAHFTGTEQWFRHAIVRRVLYTEGVQFLAERAGAYWLLDKIACLQLHPRLRRMAFQAWNLKVTEGVAMLVCEDGNEHPIYAEHITFTDFPLDEIELWVEADEAQRVILLPSEH